MIVLLLGLLGLAPSAHASEDEVLYSQLDNFTNSGYFTPPPQFILDDFAVPSGVQWTVTQFNFRGFRVLLLPTYTLAVYEASTSDPTLPGAEVAIQPLASADISSADGAVTVTLPEPLTLQPGRYWIGIDGYSVTTRTPVIGQRAAFGGSGSFVPLNPLNGEPVDLAFSLIGTAQTLATPATAVEKFDELAASAGLQAAGPGKSAPARFAALRSMLVAASTLYDSGDLTGACTQWDSATKRIHTQGAPSASHFASGPSAAELVTAIDDVQTSLCT